MKYYRLYLLFFIILVYSCEEFENNIRLNLFNNKQITMNIKSRVAIKTTEVPPDCNNCLGSVNHFLTLFDSNFDTIGYIRISVEVPNKHVHGNTYKKTTQTIEAMYQVSFNNYLGKKYDENNKILTSVTYQKGKFPSCVMKFNADLIAYILFEGQIIRVEFSD